MHTDMQLTLLENELDSIIHQLETMEETMRIMRERQNIIYNIIEDLRIMPD